MAVQLGEGMEFILDGCVLGGVLMDDGPVVSPTAKVETGENPPQRVDLRGMASPIEIQNGLGSCSANAAVGAMEFHLRVNSKGESYTDLSRLFVWYNARKFNGAENKLTGASPTATMASIMAYGVCPATDWPYMHALATQKPHDGAYEAAKRFNGIEYARIDGDLAMMMSVARGIPVFLCLALPRDLWLAARADGHVPLPQGDWPAPKGGHAVLLMGYDLPKRHWIVRNSWGAEYGDGGYNYIPFDVFDFYSHKYYRSHGIDSMNWAIGAISETKGMSVEGAFQLPEFQLPTLNAAPGFPSGLKPPQPGNGPASDTLGSRLDAARSSLRDRLRGGKD